MSFTFQNGIGISGPQPMPASVPTDVVVGAAEGCTTVQVGGPDPNTYYVLWGQLIDDPNSPGFISSGREILFRTGAFVRFSNFPGDVPEGIIDFFTDLIRISSRDTLRETELGQGYVSILNQAPGESPQLILNNSLSVASFDIVDTGTTQFFRLVYGVGTILGVDNATGFLYINSQTKIGNTILDPRGWIELDQGSLTLPPFVYNTGVSAQTTLIDGAKNFNGSNEFITANGVNYMIVKAIVVSVPLVFAGSGPNSCEDVDVSIPGADIGDPVSIAPPADAIGTDNWYFGFVKGADIVTVRHCTFSGFAPGNSNFTITVHKI